MTGFVSWGSAECLGAIVFSVGVAIAWDPDLLHAITCFLFSNVSSVSLHGLFLTTSTKPWCCLPASECGQLEAHSHYGAQSIYLVSVIRGSSCHFLLQCCMTRAILGCLSLGMQLPFSHLTLFLKNSFKNYSIVSCFSKTKQNKTNRYMHSCECAWETEIDREIEGEGERVFRSHGWTSRSSWSSRFL